MKLREDNEMKSQDEQRNPENEINGLLVMHEFCKSCELELQEEKCKTCLFVLTGENVNPVGQSNNAFAEIIGVSIRMQTIENQFKCNFCDKYFSKKYVRTFS